MKKRMQPAITVGRYLDNGEKESCRKHVFIALRRNDMDSESESVAIDGQSRERGASVSQMMTERGFV